MKKVGITGQNGFIGSHLLNYLSLQKAEYEVIPFQREYFQCQNSLENWVSKCDVVVHLAALNRHHDPDIIFSTNVDLVDRLISAMEKTHQKPHIVFSSSTQENTENLYGKSKSEGRTKLVQWGTRNDSKVTGMIVPNVFGPFGKPFYNSVVGTFCYQLCVGQTPKIEIDATLKLIYVDELVKIILQAINSETSVPEMVIPHTSERKVSDILGTLKIFKELYFEQGVIPCLKDHFEINLFNTFRSYIDHASFFPFKLKLNADQRGAFVEMIKLNTGGQVSFSTTYPGIIRGNHFHTRKIERFVVIRGKALIQLRKYNTNEVLEFELDGSEPAYVDMPVWYSHNIKNIGDEDLYTVFWINEFFDPNDPDTYFENV